MPQRPHPHDRPQTVARARTRHTGYSLVELLVGLALGMYLIAGALALVATQLREHRLLSAEARLLGDLQAAADRLTRDLRRAGHWGDATAALWDAERDVRVNPYVALAPTAAASSAASFRYSRDGVENHVVDGNEEFGYRLRNGNLEAMLGAGNWQTVTDPALLTVTAFSLTPEVREERLESWCHAPCSASAVDCPPRVAQRVLKVSITARATADTRIVRQLSTGVQLRNDALSGRCPA